MASEHRLISMKIAITVSQCSSMGLYTSNMTLSHISNDCFDLPAFTNLQKFSQKKSDIGNFEPSHAKTAALYKNLIHVTRTSGRILYLASFLSKGPC